MGSSNIDIKANVVVGKDDIPRLQKELGQLTREISELTGKMRQLQQFGFGGKQAAGVAKYKQDIDKLNGKLKETNALLTQARSTPVGGATPVPGSVGALRSRITELKSIREGAKQGSREVKRLNQEILRLEKGLNKATGASTRFSRDLQGFSRHTLVILSMVYAAQRLGQAFFVLATRGAEFTSMMEAFEGTTKDLDNLRKAGKNIVSDEKLLAFSNKATDLGISLKDQPIFVDMALHSMKAYGKGVENLDETMEKVIKSTETAQKELSSLGIKKVDFQRLTQKLAKSLIEESDKYEEQRKDIGKNLSARKDLLHELDAEDVKLVKVKAILELYGKTLEDVTEGQRNTTDEVLSLSATMENLSNSIGQKLTPAIVNIVPAINSMAGSIAESDKKFAGFAITLGLLSITAGAFAAKSGNVFGAIGGIGGGIVSLYTGLSALFPPFIYQIEKIDLSVQQTTKDIEAQKEELEKLYEKGGLEGYNSALNKVIESEKERLKVLEDTRKELLKQKSDKIVDRYQGQLEVLNGGNSDEGDFLEESYKGLLAILHDITPAVLEGSKVMELWADRSEEAADELNNMTDEVFGLIAQAQGLNDVTTIANLMVDAVSRGDDVASQLWNTLHTVGVVGAGAFFGISKAVLASESNLFRMGQALQMYANALVAFRSGNIDLMHSLINAANALIGNLQGKSKQEETEEKTNPSGTKGRGSKTPKDYDVKLPKVEDLFNVEDAIKRINDKYLEGNVTLEESIRLLEKFKLKLIDELLNPVDQEYKFTLSELAWGEEWLTTNAKALQQGEKITDVLSEQLDKQNESVNSSKEFKASEEERLKREQHILNYLYSQNKAFDDNLSSIRAMREEEARLQLKQLEPVQSEISLRQASIEFKYLEPQNLAEHLLKSNELLSLERDKFELLEKQNNVRKLSGDLSKDAIALIQKETDIARIRYNITTRTLIAEREAMIAEQRLKDARNPNLQENDSLFGVTAFSAMEESVLSLADVLRNSISDAWTDIFGEANSLLEQFAKNLYEKILNALLTLAANALITFILNALTGGAYAGATGAIGLIGGRRASGGNVYAGKSYMTGERGRELFIPNVNGTIMNAHQTSNILANSAMTQKSIVNVYLTGLLSGQQFLKTEYPKFKGNQGLIRL